MRWSLACEASEVAKYIPPSVWLWLEAQKCFLEIWGTYWVYILHTFQKHILAFGCYVIYKLIEHISFLQLTWRWCFVLRCLGSCYSSSSSSSWNVVQVVFLGRSRRRDHCTLLEMKAWMSLSKSHVDMGPLIFSTFRWYEANLGITVLDLCRATNSDFYSNGMKKIKLHSAALTVMGS